MSEATKKIPDILPAEERERIASIVNAKATLPCPRCGGSGFSLADGYFSFSLLADPRQLKLEGQVIPCVATICRTCGFVSFHNLAPLGLMPGREGAK